MKRSKFNETKILAILKEAEAGMTVAEISRKYGFMNGFEKIIEGTNDDEGNILQKRVNQRLKKIRTDNNTKIS